MKKNIIIPLVIIIILAVAYICITKKTPMKEIPSGAEAKINIDAVCQGALAYMTFPDGASAEKFVAECKEGKHPQVIEDYKKSLDLGEAAAI